MLADARADDDERLLVLLAYGLFLIAPPMGGFTGLIGVVIAHIRLTHVAGTIHESHYRNQIRVFWTMLVCWVLALALLSGAAGISFFTLLWPFGWPWHALMLGAGWVMLLWLAALFSLVLVIWYYWRLIRGFVRELDDKPY
jgi:uncharacterized membrane protein